MAPGSPGDSSRDRPPLEPRARPRAAESALGAPRRPISGGTGLGGQSNGAPRGARRGPRGRLEGPGPAGARKGPRSRDIPCPFSPEATRGHPRPPGGPELPQDLEAHPSPAGAPRAPHGPQKFLSLGLSPWGARGARGPGPPARARGPGPPGELEDLVHLLELEDLVHPGELEDLVHPGELEDLVHPLELEDQVHPGELEDLVHPGSSRTWSTRGARGPGPPGELEDLVHPGSSRTRSTGPQKFLSLGLSLRPLEDLVHAHGKTPQELERLGGLGQSRPEDRRRGGGRESSGPSAARTRAAPRIRTAVRATPAKKCRAPVILGT